MSEDLNKQLYDACYDGELEIVISLLEQGTDIHAENDYAVRRASGFGYLEVVKYLVSQGADINANDNYAVRMASHNGHLEIVRYLVSQGADVHANNNSAVQWASLNEYLDVVAYLVSQGASTTHISEFHRQYTTIYMKHYKRREIRATSKIYFWWIRRCYPLSSPSGIRMAYRNLAEYEGLCAS